MNEKIKEYPLYIKTFIDGYPRSAIFKNENAEDEAIFIMYPVKQKDIDYINSNGIDKIVIDRTLDKELSLEFLTKLNNIKYLAISGLTETEYVYYLKGLRYLAIDPIGFIDVSKFPKLEWISTYHADRIRNIENAKSLKSLTLRFYEGKGTDKFIEKASKLPDVDTLVLDRSNISNLDFLKNMRKLKVLILKECRSLSNIEAIKNVSSSLNALKFILVPKIVDYSPLRKLENLIYLNMNKCNKVTNLDFIDEMYNLNTTEIFKTNVIEGDLTPLMRLPYAMVYPNKRHYHYYEGKNKINTKTEKLPNYEFDYGNKEIELWRRIYLW